MSSLHPLLVKATLVAAFLINATSGCLNQLYGDDEGAATTIISSDMHGAKSYYYRPPSNNLDNPTVAPGAWSAPERSSADSAQPLFEDTTRPAHSKNRRVCYPDGVCFSTDQIPYNGLPLPIPPVGMPLRYYLYTPESSAVEDLPVSAESANFLDDRPLKLFIHGFGMNAGNVLVIEFARKMVYRCECNVIVVDWRGGSFGGYTNDITTDNFKRRTAVAFSNSRVAARILGKFLHRLYDKRPHTILPQYGLHCIGVDIGAHICAQLQESFHEPLARISALNPTVPSGCGYTCLDQNDATQVDVIHTTKGGTVGSDRASVVQLGDMGANEAVGHLDFFVNWHLSTQPNCAGRYRLLPVRCSMSRALELFTLSIGETCPFVSRSCAKSPASKCQPCTAPYRQCVRMGWMANKSLLIEPAVNRYFGKFFIDTLEESPYCGFDD